MRTLALLALLAAVPGCLTPATGACGDDPMHPADPADAGPTDPGDPPDPGELPDVSDAITYRDLTTHPGCTVEGLTYPAASIAGFGCSAKAYRPATETPGAPIVLLVHGNSDRPTVWETHSSSMCDPRGATQGAPMLAERLVAAGYRVYALDLRFDRVDDPASNNETENAAKNMDHGWGVPLAQHFIASVLDAFPDRQVSLVAHSFGVTVVRDALRRLYVNDDRAVWERIEDVVLLAGGNHGVSTYPLCGLNPTMRGRVTCEMGDRAAFSPTPFLAVLNGPGGDFETPCGDGETAYGRPDACGGHSVDYTTVVMQDLPDSTQQDIFVSEASSRLRGAENLTVALNDFDQSDYFFCGLFKDHYGPARALRALDLIESRLSD